MLATEFFNFVFEVNFLELRLHFHLKKYLHKSLTITKYILIIRELNTFALKLNKNIPTKFMSKNCCNGGFYLNTWMSWSRKSFTIFILLNIFWIQIKYLVPLLFLCRETFSGSFIHRRRLDLCIMLDN